MNDLHDHLDDVARAHDVPAGDLDAVLARGRRRTRTARAGVGVLTVLAVGVTGFVVATDGDADETPIAAGDTGTTTGDSGITWTRAEPTSALSHLRPMSPALNGALYALSTAPGQAPTDELQPLRVWTSADGVDWRDVGAPQGDIYLSDLDAADGRLYAIGTGQATAATTETGAIPELRVGWSDDEGSTWQTGGLDVDLDAIAAQSTAVSWTQRAVATNGDTVVAAVGVHAQPDVRALLPEGATAPNGWAISGAGVDVLGPAPEGDPCPAGESPDRAAPSGKDRGEGDETPDRVWPYGCQDGDRWYSIPPQEVHGVERTYTWSELGVGGDVLRAVLGHPLLFAASVDDGTFERVDIALPAMELGWSTLASAAGGFDIVLSNPDGTTGSRLHSADGRTWSDAGPLPGGLQWVSNAGSLGGRAVLFGTTADNETVAVVGDAVVRARDLLGDAADGRDVFLAGADAGEAGIAMVVGAVRDEDVDYVLLTSRDGATWDVEPLDELAGARVTNVLGVTVTDARMLVNVTPDGERDDEGYLRQLVLVGTI